jgi:transcription elongation factor GreA
VIAASALDDLLVSAQGYERLRRELETLRGDGRRAMSERLREARADGHLEDNLALFDLLQKQAQFERRIATLEAWLAASRIAEPNSDGSAGIGSPVRPWLSRSRSAGGVCASSRSARFWNAPSFLWM